MGEKELNIPRLIQPDHLADGKVDDRSVKTYVSFFPLVEQQRGAAPPPKRTIPPGYLALTHTYISLDGILHVLAAEPKEVDERNARIRRHRRRLQAITNEKKKGEPKQREVPLTVPYGMKQIKKCEDELDKIAKYIDDLKRQKDDALAKLKKAEQENADLRTENEQLKKQLREKTQRVFDLEAEEGNLKQVPTRRLVSL